MSAPRVSVIIPTYNRAEFIETAIDSVLQQKPALWNARSQRAGKADSTGPAPFEVIVVDDGSTDDTENLLKKYGPKIRYIKIAHSGKPAAARNYGLAKAKGELIAFQDSDDLWVADKLASQLPLFDDPAVVMSYGNARIMDAAGQEGKKLYIKSGELAGGEKFASLLKSNVISTLTVLARKSAIDQAGSFNEDDELRAVEDYDLWLRIAAAHPKGIKSVNKTLAIHRAHPGNISQADALLAIERLIAVYDSLWQAQLSKAQRQALEKQILEMHRNWGRLKDEANERPLISVVMGIYKGEQYVKAAVQSILNQTWRDFEFIIINDGSPDRSPQIIKSLKDPRIRLINQTNHGLVYTLNKGISLARAAIIARQDADDVSQPTRLEQELSLLVSHASLGLVSCFFNYIDEQGQPTGTVITSPTKHLDLRRALYVNNPFSHGGAMFRKSAYEKAGDYTDDYGPTEDYQLWCRIADDEWLLGMVPEILYSYRLVPAGISQRAGKVQHDFAAKIVREQFAKPFVRKGHRAILKDAAYYRQLDTPLAVKIHRQYIDQQYVIAMEAFARGWFKTGVMTAAAAWRLDKSLGRRLWRPAIGGFLRKLGVRKRKS